MSDQKFAVEQLENRLEQLCLYLPYIGTCYKHILWFTIPYPCLKWHTVCF